MERTLGYVRSSLRGAVIVLVPMLLVLYLGERILHGIQAVLLKLSGWLPESTPFRAFVTLVAILFIGFLVGAFLNTRAGRNLTEWLETKIFERLPGYDFLRALVRRIGGMDNATGFEPVLAEMEGGFVVAFQVEEYDNGFVSLFLPASPTPTSGSVYLYPKSMVHPIDVSFFKTIRCVTRWGTGARPLLDALAATPEGAATLDRIRTREP